MFVGLLAIIAKKKDLHYSVLYFSATQSSVTNPKIPVKMIKDHGLKTAPDGRLIIIDGNEKNSDNTEERSKKRKASFLQNVSEEDDYGKTLLEFFFRDCANDMSFAIILYIL